MSISSKVIPKTLWQVLPTTPQITGSQRIRWSRSEWRNPAQWPWFTGIGIMWKAWKISCVSAGASTISHKIANGSEKLEPVSIEVPSSSHFFPVQISKWKIQTNRKWDVIPFCLEITWEWASSICNSTGTKGKMSERAEKQITLCKNETSSKSQA